MSSEATDARPLQTGEPTEQPAPTVILIVDDDHDVRSTLARALRARGYATVECGSGEEALAIIGNESVTVDLVLCDTFLGGMNGDETARLVGLARPELPVISMSGYPKADDGPVSGMPRRYFIAKPFRSRVLSALIQQALADA